MPRFMQLDMRLPQGACATSTAAWAGHCRPRPVEILRWLKKIRPARPIRTITTRVANIANHPIPSATIPKSAWSSKVAGGPVFQDQVCQRDGYHDAANQKGRAPAHPGLALALDEFLSDDGFDLRPVLVAQRHIAKASTRTRAPSCSDPYRSIRRGSSADMDWRSYC